MQFRDHPTRAFDARLSRYRKEFDKNTSSTRWDVNLSAKKLMAFIAAAVHGSSIASYYLQLRLLNVWDLVNPYGVNAKLLANCLWFVQRSSTSLHVVFLVYAALYTTATNAWNFTTFFNLPGDGRFIVRQKCVDLGPNWSPFSFHQEWQNGWLSWESAGLLSGRSRVRTPAGPTLRVFLFLWEESAAFVITSANG